MFLKPFKGKHILITGGATGLGLAMAKAFAREHAHVSLIDSDKELLAEAQREIESLGNGIRCLTYACNIGHGHILHDYIHMLSYEFGTLDGIIACPSPIPPGALHEINHRDIDTHMDTHIKGTLHAIRTSIPLIAEHDITGGFVGIVSPEGRGVSVSAATSHAALTALAHTLRAEYARDRVRVHLLIPPTKEVPHKYPVICKRFMKGIVKNRKVVTYGIIQRMRRFTLRYFPLAWTMVFKKNSLAVENDSREEIYIKAASTPKPVPSKRAEEPVAEKTEKKQTPVYTSRVAAGKTSSGFTLYNQTLLKSVIVSMEFEDLNPFLHSITKHVNSFDAHITEILISIADMHPKEESFWELEVEYEGRQIPFQIDVAMNQHEVFTVHFYTNPKLALIIDQEFDQSLSA